MNNNSQVIKGKRYNTASAKFICNTPEGKLYKKTSANRFFLCFLELQGNIRRTAYKPVTWSDAEKLIHQYGQSIQYDELFRGGMYAGSSKKRSSIDLSHEDYANIRYLAGCAGQSATGYLHNMIATRMKAKERRDKKNK